MKSHFKKAKKNPYSLRQQILKSLLASFKIEGIDISSAIAQATLKKVEISLGK